MKRLIALFVLLCLVLCACGNNTPAETTGTTAAETTAEPTVEATTQETDPPGMYRNPLNGEILNAPYTGTPVAVLINNLDACLPQYGINEADFYYEIETEGGITRCLAIFSDISQAESVGPVRSVRTFFNSVAASYGAPIVHCGGSDRGINGGYEDSDKKIPDWQHVNEQLKGYYFFRNEDRYNYQGYNWEHTLFAKGEKLAQAMKDQGYTKTTSVDFGIAFEDVVALEGETANTVTITFRGGKTTKMTYDAATGLYTMHQYGDTTIDALTNETTTFKNVISLATDQWNVRDTGYSRSYYELTETEGVGTLAIDGQIVPIKWARDGLTDSFTYTLEDGTPVTLAAGRTYVAIVGDTDTPAVYE